MIVLGLVGRPDRPKCHDAAACLVVDGEIVGALEQERVSRRRHSKGEGPEGAVRALLTANNVRPSDVDAIGFAWADAPEGTGALDTDLPCGVHASDALTSVLLPSLHDELGTREIFFFDHHLCHAAQVYCLNPYLKADILVADGWGGDGSTSLFHVDNGVFRLLERYDKCYSLGIFYGAASEYATVGWWGAGKLMGLSAYGRCSDRRFMTFDPMSGEFALDRGLKDVPPHGMDWDTLGRQWVEIFAANVFPYTSKSGNRFDYAPFAADAQATLEDLGLGLAARLRALSGEDTLLLSGGVALNASMNRRIARESGYLRVSGTVAPNDGGTVFGAAALAASVMGSPIGPVAGDAAPAIFLGPKVTTRSIEAALEARGVAAETMEPDKLRTEVANTLGRGQIVAWFDGASEFGPRALGARSLLASPRSRAALDRLNVVKGRESWRPAALSLTADAFLDLEMEPPVPGLSDYMLCTHAVGAEQAQRAVAGVHVDGSTRAQYVPDGGDGFGALLAEVRLESGLGAVVNTSLNTRGEPMVLTPGQGLDLMSEIAEIDVMVLAPYVVRRS